MSVSCLNRRHCLKEGALAGAELAICSSVSGEDLGESVVSEARGANRIAVKRNCCRVPVRKPD